MAEYKDRLRTILHIGKGKPILVEEENNEESLEEMADYIDYKKQRLLTKFEQECSPNAYQSIEDIVNQVLWCMSSIISTQSNKYL